MSNAKEEIARLSKGYFGRITSAAFSANDKGQRLFHQWKLFSKTYIIDSEETEVKLRKKLVTFYRINLIIFFVLMTWMNAVMKSLKHASEVAIFFLGITALFSVIWWIWMDLLFREDVKSLTSFEGRITFQERCSQTASKYSTQYLTAVFIFGIFILITSFTMIKKDNPLIVIGIIGVPMFSYVTFSWGYALFIRLFRKNKTSK